MRLLHHDEMKHFRAAVAFSAVGAEHNRRVAPSMSVRGAPAAHHRTGVNKFSIAAVLPVQAIAHDPV